MKIAYLFSCVLLFILFLGVEKKREKLNLLKEVGLAFVFWLCYNTLLCYFLSIIHIPITLGVITLFHLGVSLVLIFRLLKTKTLQRYKIEKADIIFFSVFLIFLTFFSYQNFGQPYQIKYSTEDPSVHYIAAKTFYEEDSLLDRAPKNKLYDLDIMMPISYVNIGLLLKSLDDFIPSIDFYKVFITFDLFLYFLAGILFYSTLIEECKTKKRKILAFFFSIIYLLGYPLTSLLFGFFYLDIAILLVNAIILLIKEGNTKWYFYSFLSLLLFGVFFSYYLFVPVVYVSVFLYLLIGKIQKREKVFSIENGKIFFIVFLLPFLTGFTYHILPGLLEENTKIATEIITEEGFIYSNLFANFIAFIPFIIYVVAKKVQQKENHFVSILFMILLGFMAVLFIGAIWQITSTYYFFKNYFLLWLLALYLSFQGMQALLNHTTKGFILAYLSTYIILLSACFFNLDEKIQNKNKYLNLNPNIDDFMNIYYYNKYHFYSKKDIIYTQKELEILKYVEQKIDLSKEKTIGIIGNTNQILWFYSLLGYTNLSTKKEIYNQEKIDLNQYEYLIYFKRDTGYKEEIKKGRIILIENEEAGVLKKDGR